jgi:hypothetical protein
VHPDDDQVRQSPVPAMFLLREQHLGALPPGSAKLGGFVGGTSNRRLAEEGAVRLGRRGGRRCDRASTRRGMACRGQRSTALRDCAIADLRPAEPNCPSRPPPARPDRRARANPPANDDSLNDTVYPRIAAAFKVGGSPPMRAEDACQANRRFIHVHAVAISNDSHTFCIAGLRRRAACRN